MRAFRPLLMFALTVCWIERAAVMTRHCREPGDGSGDPGRDRLAPDTSIFPGIPSDGRTLTIRRCRAESTAPSGMSLLPDAAACPDRPWPPWRTPVRIAQHSEMVTTRRALGFGAAGK